MDLNGNDQVYAEFALATRSSFSGVLFSMADAVMTYSAPSLVASGRSYM